MPPALILASTSRYRRELLGRLGLPFEVVAPDVDEAPRPTEAPRTRALRLSKEKAMAIASIRSDCVVIGSDQVAVCGDQILDKPGNAARCREQLQRLSGGSAAFYSAVAVVSPRPTPMQQFVDTTEVAFRVLQPAEIERYIEAEQPFDCAGGFRSEALGIALFRHVSCEDPTGLIGLPLIRLAHALRTLGYALP